VLPQHPKLFSTIITKPKNAYYAFAIAGSIVSRALYTSYYLECNIVWKGDVESSIEQEVKSINKTIELMENCISFNMRKMEVHVEQQVKKLENIIEEYGIYVRSQGKDRLYRRLEGQGRRAWKETG